MILNENFDKLGKGYIFARVSQRLKAYDQNKLFKLGIGDGILPLSRPCVNALIKASSQMSKKSTFKGYPPAYGYEFLKQSIKDYYIKMGAQIETDSIFITDGAKSGLASILELFGKVTAVINLPSYPAYVSANILRGNKIQFLNADESNNFLPTPDGLPNQSHLIYICSPDNPTGQVYPKTLLEKWVDYANRTGSVIIFDGAYSRYVTNDAPKSIFEIQGAKTCAIEVNSFSKFACFTGMRCGWIIIDEAVNFNGKSLQSNFRSRQDALFNGVSYPVQWCANAVFTEKGEREAQKTVDYYLKNARKIKAVLKNNGVSVLDKTNSPYVWFRCPNNLTDQEFFDYLLDNFMLVGTPGSGFGESCNHYFRLSAFCDKSKLNLAMERLDVALKQL